MVTKNIGIGGTITRPDYEKIATFIIDDRKRIVAPLLNKELHSWEAREAVLKLAGLQKEGSV